MRAPDPTLPSITFVLSQAQPATMVRRSSTRRRGKFSVRRSKSSPSFALGPHPPRYPPQLDSDFLKVRNPLPFDPSSADRENRINQSINHFDARKTVDYRFSDSPPPRAPSRSSFALVCNKFHETNLFHLHSKHIFLLKPPFTSEFSPRTYLTPIPRLRLSHLQRSPNPHPPRARHARRRVVVGATLGGSAPGP